jgi:hypothetical protein
LAVVFCAARKQTSNPAQPLHPAAHRALELGQRRYEAVASSDRITSDDLARWQAEGEAMTLDELAEFTLAALREAQAGLVEQGQGP